MGQSVGLSPTDRSCAKNYIKILCLQLFSIFLILLTLYFYTMSVERFPCIFCNIAHKLEQTELLYEDDEICIFRDITPATAYHTLTIPKAHIEDVKALNSTHKELGKLVITPGTYFIKLQATSLQVQFEVQYLAVKKMLQVSQNVLVNNEYQIADARFGYHWPPFRSVRHLHLHTIANEKDMSYWSRMIFMKNSFWFVSPEYVESMISEACGSSCN